MAVQYQNRFCQTWKSENWIKQSEVRIIHELDIWLIFVLNLAAFKMKFKEKRVGKQNIQHPKSA
jgi:NADH:ubiquinone oxidoreductase subunit E